MQRTSSALWAACTLFWSLTGARPTHAQAWNDERTRTLVARATELRERQLADSGLAQYSATAHGFVTFLAQVGEGFPLPPKIVKADELALEVYWRAPNFSKQWIVGRRDTLLLPTDISYHRDHLGIVQNNFPNVIRLGEGDEVRDVPHPMSSLGNETYDFAVSDSLRIEIPGRTLDVYEIKVRPRDDRVPAIVGAVYVSRDDAQIVRMAFSFTRAALLDKYLEDVSVVLENSLVEARFWLPRRQEIEIRRTGTWLDFPARGIIRGRWEICCYSVNQALPPEVAIPGPEIVVAPPSRRRLHHFTGNILDSLPPEVRAVTDEDVQRVQGEARALVRAGALARARTTSASARRVGDIVRITRAEGLALGGGVRQRLGNGFSVEMAARFGFADHEPKGSLALVREQGTGTVFRLQLQRDYRDARDVPEASTLANSIAVQEFGVDVTEPYDVRAVEGSATWAAPGARRWRLSAAWESHRPVAVALRPVTGRFTPTIPALRGRGPRLSLLVMQPPEAWRLGTEMQWQVEVRASRLTPSQSASHNTSGRVAGWLELSRPTGGSRVVMRTVAGAVSSSDDVPPQELVYAGGPVTAPGYPTTGFAASRLLSQRLELQRPIPFPAFSLGRWGRTPRSAVLAPYINIVGVSGTSPFRPTSAGWYPSIGVGLLPFFQLLRVDVARSLRDGRWTLGVDIARDFWPIL